MGQSTWEADKMLDVYIHDYLLKRKLHNSAKAFMAEGKVATDPVAIDAPGGFLFEWWSVFWDIFIARTNDKHSEAAASYIETQQMKTREQQQLQLQQLQIMQQRNAQMQRGGANHPPLGGPVNGIMDNRLALLKSAGNQQGQLVQGNSGSMSAALQQIQARPHMVSDIKTEVNIGASQKSMPMDPSSIYGQTILQSKSGLGSAGLNPGINNLPLKGWPLTGIDQLRMQAQKPAPLVQNQILLAAQQQQVLSQSQAQAQNSLGSPPSYGDNDPRRFGGLPKGNLNIKEAQSARNDVCSPMQSSSPQMKMGQMQQSSSQQQEQLQQQQAQQNNRKRKQHSSSGPANSTGTGNTVGPSPNSPPSTHTPGDGIGTANSLQQANSMPKSLMMYGAEGTGGLASSSNQLDDIEHFADVALEDNVESFLSNDPADGRDIYGTLKQCTAEPKEPSKAFSFAEVGCVRTRNTVTACHFSSDGKFLASAGHDKKAVLWNMDTLQTESTSDHTHVITDVRFRPNSTQLATTTFDGSVRLWDASNPSYCLNVYPGRGAHVMSLDFHPKKNDLFCFSDSNNEIHYWTVNSFSCVRMSKGGTALVRFQPRVGQLLAAASDKVVSIFDIESDRPMHSFQAHPEVITYLSWDASGELLASVSPNCVKVWSLSTGDIVHELNGNQLHSCVFHPTYSNLLVVGGTRSLELWNMAENRRMSVQAHESIVSALAASTTGMVASAGHDGSVKLWK